MVLGKQVAITGANFPNLRTLTLDFGRYAEFWQDIISPIPKQSALLKLTHIIIVKVWQSDPAIKGLLESCRGHLKSGTFRDMRHISWDPLLTLLPSFDLDTVNIHDTDFSEDEEDIHNLPQEVLAGLAKHVNIVS